MAKMYLGNQPVRIIERSKNQLIPFPYATQTKVISGVRFNVNNDGGITVTREEALGKSSVFVLAYSLPLKTNTYYTISGGTKNISTGQVVVLARKDTSTTNDLAWFESAGVPSTSKLNDGDTVRYVAVYVGSTSLAVGESATVYPMLNEGTVAKPFEPFNRYFRIRTGANIRNPANLIPFPYDIETTEQDGLTLTVKNNGEIVVNGTSPSRPIFWIKRFKLPKGTYTFYGNYHNYTDFIYYLYNIDTGDVWYQAMGIEKTFTLDNEYNLGVLIRGAQDVSVNNVSVYPMLVKGTTTKPYLIQD